MNGQISIRCGTCSNLMQRAMCGGPTYCDHGLWLTASCDMCQRNNHVRWDCLTCKTHVVTI